MTGWISQNRERTLLILLLLLLPAAIVLLSIFLFGRTVLFWDEWIMVPAVDQVLGGSIPWQELSTPQNEHLMVFPKLAILGIASITGFDTVAEMYCSWLILTGISLLLFSLAVRYFGWSNSTLLSFVPLAWLLFGLRQWENLLFGFQINFFLCVLGVVLSVVLLDRSEGCGFPFLLALGGAVLASFTVLNGLLVWPLGLLQIILQRKEKRMLLVWGACAVPVTALYLYTLKGPGLRLSLPFFAGDPAPALSYFFAFLGSPLSSGAWADMITLSAVLIGMFVLVSAVAGTVLTVRYHLEKENAPWLALLSFSCGTALMTTLGRSGLGITQALSSRYVTFTIPGIIGLYFLYLTLSRQKGPVVSPSTWMLQGMTCLILLGVMLGLIEGVAMGMRTATDRETMACTLLHYRSASDGSLATLYPDPYFTREMAGVLEHRHLNVFSGEGSVQQAGNCTTAGSYPDLYNRIFGYKEMVSHLISGTPSP